jgi:ATP-binding cassette subfamily B protein
VKYRNDLSYVLKEIDFDLLADDKINIIGRTGSGKTSLSQTITRLLDVNEGEFLIFGRAIESIS